MFILVKTLLLGGQNELNSKRTHLCVCAFISQGIDGAPSFGFDQIHGSEAKGNHQPPVGRMWIPFKSIETDLKKNMNLYITILLCLKHVR